MARKKVLVSELIVMIRKMNVKPFGLLELLELADFEQKNGLDGIGECG